MLLVFKNNSKIQIQYRHSENLKRVYIFLSELEKIVKEKVFLLISEIRLKYMSKTQPVYVTDKLNWTRETFGANLFIHFWFLLTEFHFIYFSILHWFSSNETQFKRVLLFLSTPCFVTNFCDLFIEMKWLIQWYLACLFKP